MAERPRFGHRLEYAGFRALSAGALALSEGGAERTGALLGRAIGGLGIRRAVVLDNLRHAFPERDEDWIARVARGSWEHLGREALSFIRLPAVPTGAWLENISYPPEAVARLVRLRDQGRGMVVVTGHFGCLEAAALTLTVLGFKVNAYFQRMTNPLVDVDVSRTREALGIHLIDRRLGVRPGVEALERGELVVVVADQDARTHGVFVPFFGRLASTHRGAAVMALRARVPIFFGYGRRDGAGAYVGDAQELDVSREGSSDDVVQGMIAAFTARLEATVREWPEQYFWQHRRWKTAAPGERAAGAAV